MRTSARRQPAQDLMRPALVLLVLVPIVGLVELALHQVFARRAPGFDDYAALAPRLVELKEAGVPVLVAPAWAEPLVRQAAPQAFPLAELARPDDSGFGRFLEVSLLGASSPELSEFRRLRYQEVGAFRLTWYENPTASLPRFDFVRAVAEAEAEVFTLSEGQLTPCRHVIRAHTASGGLHGHVAYPRARYECPGGRSVGVTLIDDENYRARRCILAQLSASASVVLRFNAVPESRSLLGFAGFSYFLERDSEDEQAELSVRENAHEVGEARVVGAKGWSRFELERGAVRGDIEVVARRLARGSGDVCFALEAR